MATPASRVLTLSVILAAGCILLDGLAVAPLSRLPHLPRLPWPALALAYVVFQVPAVRVRIPGGVFSVVPTELPFVIGLLLTDPLGLVMARALSRLLVAGAMERRDPSKAVFNVVRAVLVASTGVAVYRLLLGHDDPFSLRGWGAVLTSLIATELTSTGLVGVAILTARARRTLPLSAVDLSFALLTSLASGCLAMLGVITARWSLPALAVFAVVAVLVMAAIRNTAGVRRRYQAMVGLYEFTRDVYEIVEPHDRVDIVLRRLCDMFQSAGVGLVEFGAGGQVSVMQYERGQEATGNRVRPSAWESGLRVAAERASRASMSAGELTAALREAGLADALAAPLWDARVVSGFIAIFFHQGAGRPIDESEEELLLTISRPIAAALQRDRLLAEVRREAAQRAFEATHDSLTGLANRSLLAQEIQRALESDLSPLALLLIDLDRFKEVNDTLGHDSGDLLLIAAATRLRREIGGASMVSRLGGDEFAVLARDYPTPDHVLTLARRLCLALRAPYLIQGLSVEVTASIGIATTHSQGSDATTLLRQADVAMYQAKRERADALLYQPAFDRHSRRRLTLAADLRNAVGQGNFSVAYQPIVAMADGRPVGAEALARWSDPRFRHLGPDTFIPLAEHAGLIGQLTWLILSQALEGCARWRDQGIDGCVHVNLSALSLVDPNLLVRIASALACAGVAAPSLTLEITEGTLIADFTQAEGVLQRLRGTGVKIAIDDFGVGQSSLAYLQRLSVDAVKLDKSLVAGIATARPELMVVGSAIELAHGLGLEVIAEGVEDAAVWDQLAALGCDAAQGSLLTAPLAPEEIGQWWQDHASPLGTP